MYSGQYTGTGTYGEDNPVTITFPFAISVLFLPFGSSMDESLYVQRPIYAAQLSTSKYTSVTRGGIASLYVKVSQDNKKFYWFGGYNSSQSEAAQYGFNVKKQVYFYVGFGGHDAGGQTEWILTSTQTWSVPRTGKYYIELYGGGGGAGNLRGQDTTGRSSCQSYNNVSLSVRQEISVVIGTGRQSDISSSYEYATTGKDGSMTSFGTYSVNGGEASYYTGSYPNFTIKTGVAQGNLGTNGYAGAKSSSSGYGYIANYSSGRYGKKYGYGGFAHNGTDLTQSVNGGPRAVYLKYLGA